MILRPHDTIDLDALGTAVLAFADLQYLDLPAGATLEEAAPDQFAYAVASFGRHIYDNVDREEEVRRGLGYALNLPDDRFAELVRALRVPYPRFDPAGVRRLFRALWDRWFAPWQRDGSMPAPDPKYLQMAWPPS